MPIRPPPEKDEVNEWLLDFWRYSYVADAKLSALTDGYIPYHIDDATGLANSPIFTDGTNTGFGTASPDKKVEIESANAQLLLTETGATADEGKWLFNATADAFYFQSITDAIGAGATVFQVERTGTTIDSVSFPNSNFGVAALEVNGTTHFGGATYTWPGADGADGQVLKTNGSGQFAWVNNTGSTAADHGALAGLTPDDDHPHYLLASGSRDLAGAWDLGGQNLSNGGSIDCGIVTSTGAFVTTQASEGYRFKDGDEGRNQFFFEENIAVLDNGDAIEITVGGKTWGYLLDTGTTDGIAADGPPQMCVIREDYPENLGGTSGQAPFFISTKTNNGRNIGMSLNIEDESGATTVDASSASGQPVLKVASTAGFAVNSTIRIDRGVSDEDKTILSIQSGVSLTLTENLDATYTNESVEVYPLMVTGFKMAITSPSDRGHNSSGIHLVQHGGGDAMYISKNGGGHGFVIEATASDDNHCLRARAHGGAVLFGLMTGSGGALGEGIHMHASSAGNTGRDAWVVTDNASAVTSRIRLDGTMDLANDLTITDGTINATGTVSGFMSDLQNTHPTSGEGLRILAGDSSSEAMLALYDKDTNLKFAFFADGTTSGFSPDIHKDMGKEDLEPDDYLDWALADAKKPKRPKDWKGSRKDLIKTYGKDWLKMSMGTAIWAEQARDKINQLEERLQLLEAA